MQPLGLYYLGMNVLLALLIICLGMALAAPVAIITGEETRELIWAGAAFVIAFAASYVMLRAKHAKAKKKATVEIWEPLVAGFSSWGVLGVLPIVIPTIKFTPQLALGLAALIGTFGIRWVVQTFFGGGKDGNSSKP